MARFYTSLSGSTGGKGSGGGIPAGTTTVPAPSGANNGQVLSVAGGAPVWVAQPVVQHDTAMPLLAPWTQTRAAFAAAVAGIADGSHAYLDGLIVKGPNGIDAVTPDGRWTWSLTTHDGTLGAPDRVEVWHSAAGAVPTKVAALSATGTPLTVAEPTGNPPGGTAQFGDFKLVSKANAYGSNIALVRANGTPWPTLVSGATVFGADARVTGTNQGGSTAIGHDSAADGPWSTAIGSGARSFIKGTAVGGGARAEQQGIAMGYGALARNSNNFTGVAIGGGYAGSVGTTSTDGAHSVGNAIALGINTTAQHLTVQLLANSTASGTAKAFLGPDRLVTLTELKAVVASATDFNDFKAKVAALS